MDMKLGLTLLVVMVTVTGEDVPIKAHFQIKCGGKEISPFSHFCRNGIKVPCDPSHCMMSRSEESSKRCALYCGQVLQRLEQLPIKIAALEIMQDKLALTQQNLTHQHHKIAELLNHTIFQTTIIKEKNSIITSQQERLNDLEHQNMVYMIFVVIMGCLILTMLIYRAIVKRAFPAVKSLVKRKPKCSGEDEGKPLVTLPQNTKSTTNKESTNDSAFGSTSSGSTQPIEVQPPKHKCDILNEIKPTDDNVKAPVVTNAAQPLADPTIYTTEIAEESSLDTTRFQEESS